MDLLRQLSGGLGRACDILVLLLAKPPSEYSLEIPVRGLAVVLTPMPWVSEPSHTAIDPRGIAAWTSSFRLVVQSNWEDRRALYCGYDRVGLAGQPNRATEHPKDLDSGSRTDLVDQPNLGPIEQ